MCNKRDKARVEAQVQKYRKKKYKALARQYTRKLMFEGAILDALKEKPNGLGVAAKMVVETVVGPYSVASIEVRTPGSTSLISTTSVANCMLTDKFVESTGKDMARKRAAREAARVIVGLE